MKSRPVSGCVPNAIVGIWSPYDAAGGGSGVAGGRARGTRAVVTVRGCERGGERDPGGDDDWEGREAPLADGVERRVEAFEEEPARADREGVAAVEGPGPLRARAGKVDGQSPAAPRDGHLHPHGAIERDAV